MALKSGTAVPEVFTKAGQKFNKCTFCFSISVLGPASFGRIAGLHLEPRESGTDPSMVGPYDGRRIPTAIEGDGEHRYPAPSKFGCDSFVPYRFLSMMAPSWLVKSCDQHDLNSCKICSVSFACRN